MIIEIRERGGKIDQSWIDKINLLKKELSEMTGSWD